MITLHHLNNSRSQRILWLLEELGLDYQIKFYQRDPKTMLAPPELRQIHPLGKSPVITDGTITLAESAAILEYLMDKYGEGRLKPTDPIRYRYWMHFAEGTGMPPLLMKLVFDKIEHSPAPFFVKPIIKGLCGKVRQMLIQPRLKENLDYMERELSQHPWFAGKNFSAADIQMSFVLEAAAARGGLDETYPKLRQFLKTTHARPAYKKAIEKGGAFNL